MNSRRLIAIVLALLASMDGSINAKDIPPHSENWYNYMNQFLSGADLGDPDNKRPPSYDRNAIKFFLYDNVNRHYALELTEKNLEWIDAEADKLFIIIHGWLENSNQSWIVNLRNVLLDKYTRSYVMVVDYGDPAFEHYEHSVYNTRYVGPQIGEMMMQIRETRGFSTKKMIILSFSLGCHVAGFAAKKLADFYPKISRIIAMDPAKIYWQDKPCRERLYRNDADVVVALHTDSDTLGFAEPIGTIDFYANGGFRQKGCQKITPRDQPWNSACSHSRSYEYMIEAINYPNSFKSRKCANWTLYEDDPEECDEKRISLGDLDTKEEGVFYFETNEKSPFAMDHQDGNSSSTLPSTSLTCLTLIVALVLLLSQQKSF